MAAADAAIRTRLTGRADLVSHSNAAVAPVPGATLAASVAPARVSRFVLAGGSPYSSSTIASCSAGLTRAIALLSGVGCTRLVSSVTYNDRSGSIQSDVPVKPT